MMEGFFTNELTRKRWRRFKRRRLAMASIILLFLMVAATFMAPVISNSKPIYLNYNGKSYFPVFKTYYPSEFDISDTLVMDYKNLKLSEKDTVIWPMVKWDPFESNQKVESYPSPPTRENLMGTDDRGRDVFSRVLYGFKYSILYAIAVWAISTVVAILLGGMMGYHGGRVDFWGQRVVEILSTVPTFFLLIILISIFSPTLTMLVIISSVFSWIGLSYYVRGEFLKNRQKEFVEAAKAMGASTYSIIFKHILPNSLTPVITFAPFAITANIVGLASLDFLGFGLEIPTPSWGELLSQAQKNFTVAWWLALYPSLALFFTLTLFNLIGEGIRDAMDPKVL
jgi:microcin C transport system permease protein